MSTERQARYVKAITAAGRQHAVTTMDLIRAVMAVADADLAEMSADIERLCEEGARQEARAEKAEAEQAELRAEVERYRSNYMLATDAKRINDRYASARAKNGELSRRAEAAEAELAALRGQIEALADEVRTAPAETWGVSLHVPSNAEAAYMAGADAAITFATRRLAALAASPTQDTTPAAPHAEGGAR